jgi:DNA-directed RNA polymerase specialized sigma24 family protein
MALQAGSSMQREITAMLMCLDRRQRLAFILGEIFGETSEAGAEAMEVSPDNFRQLLSRARHDLYQFTNDIHDYVFLTTAAQRAIFNIL